MTQRARVTRDEVFRERSRPRLSRTQRDMRSQRISFASALPATPWCARSMKSPHIDSRPGSDRTRIRPGSALDPDRPQIDARSGSDRTRIRPGSASNRPRIGPRPGSDPPRIGLGSTPHHPHVGPGQNCCGENERGQAHEEASLEVSRHSCITVTIRSRPADNNDGRHLLTLRAEPHPPDQSIAQNGARALPDTSASECSDTLGHSRPAQKTLQANMRACMCANGWRKAHQPTRLHDRRERSRLP